MTNTVSMKCAACGYLYHEESRDYEKVIRFQCGKRKGEIKAVVPETMVFTIGHSPFKRLFFKKGVDELRTLDVEVGYYSIPVVMYACPECGTIRMESSY